MYVRGYLTVKELNWSIHPSYCLNCTFFCNCQDRYNVLKERNYKTDSSSKVLEEFKSNKGISLYKSLSSTLDSFDNLFCRRCMVRDF